ncbi:nitroreductase family deazaflavin-dependent oxidoreductase [Phytomonospora sp. NPDC050363]|uniref:nitroreductase family deazaflavin-dependent oxidoreductase n=1 Tax=Phytomonospora sp. NPDC050363 TaxID=3155642 RepID=UPI0033F78438
MSDEAAVQVRHSSSEWVAKQARLYEESGGTKGLTVQGIPCLLVDYVGRRSGEWHRTVLMYGRDGDDYLLVASNGGSEKHPLWFLSIEANPKVRLRVETERFEADARVLSAEEKARVWPELKKVWTGWDDYQKKTERDIPVIALRRTEG